MTLDKNLGSEEYNKRVEGLDDPFVGSHSHSRSENLNKTKTSGRVRNTTATTAPNLAGNSRDISDTPPRPVIHENITESASNQENTIRDSLLAPELSRRATAQAPELTRRNSNEAIEPLNIDLNLNPDEVTDRNFDNNSPGRRRDKVKNIAKNLLGKVFSPKK